MLFVLDFQVEKKEGGNAYCDFCYISKLGAVSFRLNKLNRLSTLSIQIYMVVSF